MATTYTQRTKLAKPGPADRDWNVPLNANADALDALAPIGGLCITTLESPSATLRVQAAAGRFQRRDGTVGTFEGTSVIVLQPEAISSIYLSDSGELIVSMNGFPATSHVPLAAVQTDRSRVTAVTDLRVVCGSVGTDSRPFLTASGGTMNDGAAFATGSAAGLKIGTSATQKLGFWNALPVARPGPYKANYTTASRNLMAYNSATTPTPFAGIATDQPGVPYAQAADLNSLRLAYENLRSFSENTTQLVNALINDLKSMGLLG